MAKKATVKRKSLTANTTSQMPSLKADMSALSSGFASANAMTANPQLKARVMGENPSITAQQDMMEGRINPNRKKKMAVVKTNKRGRTTAPKVKVKAKPRGTFKNVDGQDVIGDFRAYRGE